MTINPKQLLQFNVIVKKTKQEKKTIYRHNFIVFSCHKGSHGCRKLQWKVLHVLIKQIFTPDAPPDATPKRFVFPPGTEPLVR